VKKIEFNKFGLPFGAEASEIGLRQRRGHTLFRLLGTTAAGKNFIQLQSSFGSPLSHFYLSALRNSTGREKEGMIKTH